MNSSATAPLMAGKKIAFVAYGYPIDVSATLVNSLALLSENNEIEVVATPLDFRQALYPDWVRALFLYAPLARFPLIYRCLRKLWRIALRFLFQNSSMFVWRLKNLDLLMFRRWFGRRAEKARYDLVIAVECHALIAVAEAVRPGCVLFYYNMELLDWSADNPLYEDKIPLKELEYEALRSVSRVLITNPNRARIFSEMNDFPLEKISVLPVVPRKITFQNGKSSFFRDMFAIPEDKYIVLYAGNFMPWARCLEIIESMADWPGEAVLVMHTWNKYALLSRYCQQMRAAAKGRPVYFSSRYVPYSDLARAFSSADVGLLFYEAIDANFTEILFSSNKFGEYMAAGLPVICSPFPSLAEFVEAQNIGRAVPVGNIGLALNEIMGKFEVYREHVSRCRDEYFDFDRYFAAAFKR